MNEPSNIERLRADIASIGNRQKRVLVVDDESDQRLLIRDLLGKYNIFVGDVNSGESALETLSNESYDVVLLDVKMPGMDGLEAHRLIKEKWPRIMVFLCTGHVDFPGLSIAMESGCVHVIGKNFLERSLAELFEPICKTPIK